MRVWTVHPLIVWERLRDVRTLRVDQACYHNGYVPLQYQWLSRQLRERVQGYHGGLPWWAYCKKPDLRWVRHRRPRGQPQVRIELDLIPDHMVVFPSWAWDVVYAGNLLASTKRENRAWMAAMRKAVPDEDLWPLPEPWQGELEASWTRLFDLELPTRGWGVGIGKAIAGKQAVFEALSIGDVRSVTHFVGTSRWPR